MNKTHEAAWILAGAVLLIFPAIGRCVEAPSTQTASPAAPAAFHAVAIPIENSVTRFGYPKSTADDLVQLVRSWNLETWKQKLAQAHSAASAGRTAEIARVEEAVTRALCMKIGTEIRTCGKGEEARYFFLPAVLQDRKGQCLGYSQLFYILGNSIGLTVSMAEVLEPVAGSLPPGEGHVACIVGQCDSTCVWVDLGLRFVSGPFVFQNAYAAAGNYWELRQKNNPFRVHRRLQVVDERGIVGLIYNNLAYGYQVTGESDKAASYLTKAITLNPKCALALFNRGIVYGSLGQTQRALADFNQAIELNPNDAAMFNNRGNAYRLLGQNQQALLDYSKAIELDPNSADAYNNRGTVYGALGLTQQAILDYSSAIELNPRLDVAFPTEAVCIDCSARTSKRFWTTRR